MSVAVALLAVRESEVAGKTLGAVASSNAGSTVAFAIVTVANLEEIYRIKYSNTLNGSGSLS